MCRKDLSVKQIPKTKSSLTTPLRQATTIPYSPQRTPVEETGQQITYQEFLDIVAQSNSYQQDTVVEVRPSVSRSQEQKPISNSQKLLKIVLCLGILAAIAVVLIIVL